MSALRRRPTPAKPVWGSGGREEQELVKHFEQWSNRHERPRQTATGVFYEQETALQLASSHGGNYSMRNYKIKHLDPTANKQKMEEV